MNDHMRAAQVEIPKPCDGHYRVRACFRAVGQDVKISEACRSQPISRHVVEGLPKLIATCRAAAVNRSQARSAVEQVESSAAQ